MDVPDEGGTLMRKFVDNANGNHHQSMMVCGPMLVHGCGRFNIIDAIFIASNLRRLGHDTLRVAAKRLYCRSDR